jgi:ABC-type sugar transport system ATPase subunit
MSALETQLLCKNFGALAVTQSVSLDLHAGARLGLIGPNGAGKTTLVNLLTGMLAPNSGEIILNGETLHGVQPEQRVKKGLVRTHQINTLLMEHTTRDNVAIAVAADLVADSLEGEEAILEGSQGGEDRPQCHGLLAFAGRRGERAGGGWPEVFPHRAVRAEDDDEPLPRRRGACEAGQIAEERRHGRTDPEFPQQFTASDHRSAPGRQGGERAGRPPPS